MNKEQVLTLKLERLQQLADRFSGTLWGKRAGLLSGVLLIERDPASAMQFLRGAQRDFPVLDDYIRVWIAESQLNLGQAKEAAVLLESIPMAVPDSNIWARRRIRRVKPGIRRPLVAESTTWFGRAVAMNDKDAERSPGVSATGRVPATGQQYRRRARDAAAVMGSVSLYLVKPRKRKPY